MGAWHAGGLGLTTMLFLEGRGYIETVSQRQVAMVYGDWRGLFMGRGCGFHLPSPPCGQNPPVAGRAFVPVFMH